MRIAMLEPDEMTARQAQLAARITARRGAVRGPYRVWLQSPEVCERVEALGAFVRFESSLPERLRLLTLLFACRAYDAAYSWNAHVQQARDAGISDEIIGQIARRERPAFDTEDDLVFWEFCLSVLQRHFVDDVLFARANARFTTEQLVDAIGSLGNYTMLALCLNAFEVDLQPGVESPFPDIRGYARIS